jgi:hypothetical protein
VLIIGKGESLWFNSTHFVGDNRGEAPAATQEVLLSRCRSARRSAHRALHDCAAESEGRCAGRESAPRCVSRSSPCRTIG